jgi:transcriptional regulator with XRE-family HTH domain
MSNVAEETAELLAVIGANIRALRLEQGLTLHNLGERTGLSPSMLSLLERGKTGPSIGTLVVIASALGVQMSDLLASRAEEVEVVSRAAGQPVYQVAEGVSRRILRNDRMHGIEIALSEYQPGTASVPEQAGREGFEYGFTLAGVLEVTLGDRTHRLQEGDLIAYPSPHPHRVANPGSEAARAIWFNLKRV